MCIRDSPEPGLRAIRLRQQAARQPGDVQAEQWLQTRGRPALLRTAHGTRPTRLDTRPASPDGGPDSGRPARTAAPGPQLLVCPAISSDTRRAMRSPRILYVTPYLSGVPTSATELRTAHIARALQAVGELEVIAVDDDSESEANSRG